MADVLIRQLDVFPNPEARRGAARIGRETFAVVVAEMAAVPRKLLTKPVANLSAERDRIVRALDDLPTGS